MAESAQDHVFALARSAKAASAACAQAPLELRNAALAAMAAALRAHAAEIVEANALDMAAAREKGTTGTYLDRLLLTPDRIEGMAAGLESLRALPDVLGFVQRERTLASGVELTRVSVPLGLVAMVYEARPNVTADAAGICLKTGNACILRGGSLAFHSNTLIAGLLAQAAEGAGMPHDAIVYVDSTDRAATDVLLHARGLVDLLIPRGGAGLINHCVEEATVPVIETGTGNCHVYVHAPALFEMARDIVVNAKCQRPGVCNACESLLVDESIAEDALSIILPALHEHGVVFHVDEPTAAIARTLCIPTVPATEEDWGREYLALEISVKVVSGMDEALAHIARYTTHHSECIVTSSERDAETFLSAVDAAVVYWNASTRFSDGGEFGLGAEIGISTQKLHARGPFALEALTTYKYLLRGTGQVRE